MEHLCSKYRINSILLLCSFFAINIALLIAISVPPAKGYEPSIFEPYGTFFWFLFFASVLLSTLNILLSVVSYSKTWIYSLMAIFICYTMVLFLPEIRGYFIYAFPSSDVFVHLSNIQFISTTHYLDSSLFYPSTHILSAVFYLLGIPFNYIIPLFCTFFSLYYIISFFLLGKVFFNNNSGSLMMLSFSLPLSFSFMHYSFLPYFFAFSLLPLYIYIYYKIRYQRKANFSYILIILTMSLVFFHPLTAFLVLIILLTIIFTQTIFNKLNIEYVELKNHDTIFTILGVSLLAWYLRFQSVQTKISDAVNAIFDMGQSSIVQNQLQDVSSSNADISTIIEIFIKVYGVYFIYYSVAALCLILVVRSIIQKKINKLSIIYGILYVLSILYGIVLLSRYLVVFEPIRIGSFGVFCATIFCGIIFYTEYFQKEKFVSKRQIYALFSIFIILSFCIILGTLNIYSSPWKNTVSSHMDNMDIEGLNWILEYKNTTSPLMMRVGSISKYEMYYRHFDNNKYLSRSILLNDFSILNDVYDKNAKIEKTNSNGIYVILPEFMRFIPYDQVASTNESYYDVFSDVLITKSFKIYSNSEFDIFKII